MASIDALSSPIVFYQSNNPLLETSSPRDSKPAR